MSRLLTALAAISLLFLASGCASTKSSTSGQYSSEEYAPLVRESNVTAGKTKSEVLREQEPFTRKEALVSLNKDTIQNVDDDDIASLLGQDYDKDFDIPIVFNDAVKYFIQYFTTEKRKVFANWLRRAKYYVPIIKEILKEKGLPEDLVYLAMIESGFNPKAYSPASASGPWQFIYATGGRYGLKVNNWVDERRDPEKSTIAATKYLSDLFNQFGCWYLAAAGYNAGEGRIEKAIVRHNTNDFWELVKYNTLPKETREYIPKLIAAAIIAKDPERFGFGSVTYEQPIRFLEVTVPPASPILAISKASSVDMNQLRSINPEILTGITPPDVHDYHIKLPYTVDKEMFRRKLEFALTSQKKIRSIATYKVRKGDTLPRIAKKYKIAAEDVLLVNSSGDDMKVKPGAVICIPCFSLQPIRLAESLKTRRNGAVAKPNPSMMMVEREGAEKKLLSGKPFHIVKKGETLSTIAGKYGIDKASLKSANNLKSDKVYPDQKLKLASHVQKKEQKSTRYHIVKKGETLSTIAGKYGIDKASLKSANNLKSDKVYVNMRLKITVGRG